MLKCSFQSTIVGGASDLVTSQNQTLNLRQGKKHKEIKTKTLDRFVSLLYMMVVIII